MDFVFVLNTKYKFMDYKLHAQVYLITILHRTKFTQQFGFMIHFGSYFQTS